MKIKNNHSGSVGRGTLETRDKKNFDLPQSRVLSDGKKCSMYCHQNFYAKIKFILNPCTRRVPSNERCFRTHTKCSDPL